ncbi:unnamed protein product [Blepharisma stoltei]|uniref:Uncharacterized protein n=1 Tax=Blepharisma stoltei TaxID=1481888 RepID=A0AAU9JH39_9CILI|nr:unnamed protein product [Blepharisma stoltei]
MKFLILPLAILLCYADDLAAIGKSKADELRALSYKSDGLIKLTASGFQKFVVDYPRPYTLVVFLTSKNPTKFKCQLCDEIGSMLDQVIYSYRGANADLPLNTPGSKSRAVFFAILEYNSENQPIFQKFKFASVPNLIVTSPKSIKDEGDRYSYYRDEVWEFSKDGDVHPQKLLDFINARSGRKIELKTSPFAAIISMGMFMLIFTTFAFVIYKIKSFLLIPYVWYAGGLTIYFICISGFVYDIIHGVPMVGTNGKGEAEFIHSGQRSQYGAEGFMMGFLMVIGGLGFVGLNILHKLEKPSHIRLVGGLCFLIVIFSFYKIIKVYQVKASWYGPGLYPPGHYIKGPLINDQGSSF